MAPSIPQGKISSPVDGQNKSIKPTEGPSEGSLPVYIYACDRDFKAGMLLWRLAHLCRHTYLLRDGIRWYVRTRSDLMNDLAFSKHEYDRAIRVLRQRGLIETSNAAKLRYPHASMQATAFAITPAGRDAIAKGRSIVERAYKK